MYAVYTRDLRGIFRPLDLPNGTTTQRLLFASLFSERIQAVACKERLQCLNPHLEFEVRKVGN